MWFTQHHTARQWRSRAWGHAGSPTVVLLPNSSLSPHLCPYLHGHRLGGPAPARPLPPHQFDLCLDWSPVHHHPGYFQVREAEVRGWLQVTPGPSTLLQGAQNIGEAADLVAQRAGFLIMQSRQAPARRPVLPRLVERGASWGCLADALIFTPSSGLLEKKRTSQPVIKPEGQKHSR